MPNISVTNALEVQKNIKRMNRIWEEVCHKDTKSFIIEIAEEITYLQAEVKYLSRPKKATHHRRKVKNGAPNVG